jgi:hypothetical protein
MGSSVSNALCRVNLTAAHKKLVAEEFVLIEV